jgi:hypothetical protein
LGHERPREIPDLALVCIKKNRYNGGGRQKTRDKLTTYKIFSIFSGAGEMAQLLKAMLKTTIISFQVKGDGSACEGTCHTSVMT